MIGAKLKYEQDSRFSMKTDSQALRCHSRQYVQTGNTESQSRIARDKLMHRLSPAIYLLALHY